MCLIQLPKQVLLLRARTLMVEHYIGLPYANSSGENMMYQQLELIHQQLLLSRF